MTVSRLLALSLLALAVPVAPAAAACDVSVGFPNFSPASHSVPAGGTVTWCWAQGGHSVTGDFDDSGVRQANATFSHTFQQAGTYSYVCSEHPSMQGSIVVGQATTSPTPTQAPTTRPKTSAPAATRAAAPATTHPVTTAPAVTRTPTPSPTPTPTATPTPTTAAPTTKAATTAPASPSTSPAALEIDPAPAKPKTGLAIALGLLVALAAFGGAGWLLLRGRP